MSSILRRVAKLNKYMNKFCSKCKISKPSLDFSKCSKSKSGLQSQCKSCKITSVKMSPSYNDKEYRRSIESTEHRKEYKKEYHHKTKLARNISRRIRQSLNDSRKSVSWTTLVDFTKEELKIHLESLFLEGMTWDNYGSVWHIDHIIPISRFNISSPYCDDFKLCWSLNNLQPLFAIDNLKKSNKYIPIVS